MNPENREFWDNMRRNADPQKPMASGNVGSLLKELMVKADKADYAPFPGTEQRVYMLNGKIVGREFTTFDNNGNPTRVSAYTTSSCGVPLTQQRIENDIFICPNCGRTMRLKFERFCQRRGHVGCSQCIEIDDYSGKRLCQDHKYSLLDKMFGKGKKPDVNIQRQPPISRGNIQDANYVEIPENGQKK